MERGESELEGKGEWPRRPFQRGRKANPVGCTLMAFFLLAFVFYLWVRISKTLDLAQYTWCAPGTPNGWRPLLVPHPAPLHACSPPTKWVPLGPACTGVVLRSICVCEMRVIYSSWG